MSQTSKLSLVYSVIFLLYASCSVQISEGSPLNHSDPPSKPCPSVNGGGYGIKDPEVVNNRDPLPPVPGVAVIPNQELIVCRVNICATVRCNLQEADSNPQKCTEEGGIIDPKGGFCGCCPICVIQLKEGDNCAITQIRGVPARAKCVEGLQCCSKTEKCQKATGC